MLERDQIDLETTGHRLVANLRRLIQENDFSQARTAGLADMGESTLQKLLNNPETANPELLTLQNLADALGARNVSWLLLPTDELEQRITKEGLLPFRERPDVSRSNSRSGLTASGAAADRSRFRAKTRAAAKTSRSSASNRCFRHTRVHQACSTRPPRQVCIPRIYKEHPARPGRKLVLVRETLLPGTKAA